MNDEPDGNDVFIHPSEARNLLSEQKAQRQQLANVERATQRILEILEYRDDDHPGLVMDMALTKKRVSYLENTEAGRESDRKAVASDARRATMAAIGSIIVAVTVAVFSYMVHNVQSGPPPSRMNSESSEGRLQVPPGH